jgi:parallel beta-helix repeat protein
MKRKPRWIRASVCVVTGLALTLSSGASFAATVIYVNGATGGDGNDGSDSTLAKRTVQAALDAAVAGDQVWVAAGTYMGCITLTDGVELYGGFAGSETELTQRDWVANRTVLDGNQGGSVVTSPVGATATTRIDGFTIRNGKAAYGGGGIACSSSSPMITNNTITGNNASRAGGGIYSLYSSPIVDNNTITGNASSSMGGGICCAGSSAPRFTNNTITENTASSTGGGIYCDLSCSAIITDNAIERNTVPSSSAYQSGGITCYQASPTIVKNTIAGNTGSAISCFASSSPMIANNTLDGNTGRYVGGIYCGFSSATIANNTITCNRGGGISCAYESSPTIVNTIVAFNSTGIDTDGSSAPTLRYNCVYANMTYNYSGMSDPTGTNGNISADPKLPGVRYGDNDWHIQPDSPCVNAGDDSVVQPGWVDIDGQPRVQGSHVDIGADESDGTAWPANPHVIVRVSPDGDDANDGSTWTSAKRTVQGAIETASALRGDVWVKAGTYPERITLRAYVHVYGGFSGAESARDQRDFRANVAILDGQQGGSVVTVLEGYAVSTIDGFTIRNGTGTLSGSSRYGGGIYCDHASPAIVNCVIGGNTATYGGAICCVSASPMIWNNTIAGNTASFHGAGICCRGSIPEGYCSPAITNNAIVANSGDGIYCTLGFPAITNCVIVENTGYGIACSYLSSPRIMNTIVAFNGRGIYCIDTSSSPVLTYNCVYGNTASNYGGLAGPTGKNGNLKADPLFVRNPSDGGDGWGVGDNDDYGDLRLRARSPCIDAGDNAGVPAGGPDLDGDGDAAEPWPFDLAGNPRFVDDPAVVDTGAGTPPIVDIGAYEFIPGDCDHDDDVDLVDFLHFQGCFNGSNRPYAAGGYADADLDGDADVDLADYAIFEACFNGPNRAAVCR